ncbi:MAG: hypothetical protein GY941_21455 [Planctomycetes bacterium]|nr:hypothetical protein [Planctomycetota bacterium]
MSDSNEYDGARTTCDFCHIECDEIEMVYVVRWDGYFCSEMCKEAYAVGVGPDVAEPTDGK